MADDHGQRRQTVASSRGVAFFVAGLHFAAGRRALRVHIAGDCISNRALQCLASGHVRVGARHATVRRVELLSQAIGQDQGFGPVKRYPVAGAAGAALSARVDDIQNIVYFNSFRRVTIPHQYE